MEKNEVLQELKKLGSPLAEASRKMPFAVPQGYFESLADDVTHAVKGSHVPAGYFERLPNAMLQAAKTAHASTQPAQARKPTRVFAIPALRWAAAAALLVSFAIGGRLFFQERTSPDVALSSLPTEAVTAYAEANFADLDASLTSGAIASSTAPDLTGFTADELEAYLAEGGWVE